MDSRQADEREKTDKEAEREERGLESEREGGEGGSLSLDRTARACTGVPFFFYLFILKHLFGFSFFQIS